ncbi:Protein of unknown function [Bacillus wiedmannii]|nr:Protein of unknown function [Bacillus wiedmannii]
MSKGKQLRQLDISII